MKILVTKVDAAKTGVGVSFTVLKKKEKRGFKMLSFVLGRRHL